jgi:hypothetical protein
MDEVSLFEWTLAKAPFLLDERNSKGLTLLLGCAVFNARKSAEVLLRLGAGRDVKINWHGEQYDAAQFADELGNS